MVAQPARAGVPKGRRVIGIGACLARGDRSSQQGEEYFPYGKASDRRDERNRYRYIGVERDEATGLLMTGPRTFDAVTGRFLQGDPISAGLALLQHAEVTVFAYTSAQPVLTRDPGGLVDDKRVDDSRHVQVLLLQWAIGCGSNTGDASDPTGVSKASAGPWSAADVAAILNAAEGGDRVLSQVRASDVSVVRFTEATTITTYADGSVAKEPAAANGETRSSGFLAISGETIADEFVAYQTIGSRDDPSDPDTVIFVDTDASASQAALTLYHEVLHIRRVREGIALESDLDEEVEVRYLSLVWAVENGLDIEIKSGLLNEDGSVNKEAVRAEVDGISYYSSAEDTEAAISTDVEYSGVAREAVWPSQ